MGTLREQLLERAETSASEALAATKVPTLMSPPAPLPVAHREVALIVEEETSVGDGAPVDPELVEALARSKALEFSKDELSLLRGLSSTAMQSILANGDPKAKMAAAKLVVLMQKIERDSYLELRKQRLDSQPKRRATMLQFPEGYLAQARSGLLEGLRDVTPAKETIRETKDA